MFHRNACVQYQSQIPHNYYVFKNRYLQLSEDIHYFIFNWNLFFVNFSNFAIKHPMISG